MTEREPRPVAEPDGISRSWWDAASDGRLTVQRCRACGHAQHYPRPVCTSCGATDLEFVDASGRGTVYSFTVVHRAPHPAFEPPYVVALVRLEEGPVVLTNIVEADLDDLVCDMSVRVMWEDLPDGRRLPLFTPQGG